MAEESNEQELDNLKNMVLKRKKAYQRLDQETTNKYRELSVMDRFSEFLSLWSYNSLSNKKLACERELDLTSHKYLSLCLAKLRSDNG
ncbi:MAG: hypothetical protein R3A13_02005 [Bdellovibrionota bacterium]